MVGGVRGHCEAVCQREGFSIGWCDGEAEAHAEVEFTFKEQEIVAVFAVAYVELFTFGCCGALSVSIPNRGSGWVVTEGHTVISIRSHFEALLVIAHFELYAS